MQLKSNTNKILRILYIASEAEPLVKVGGLGDVAGSLPRTLRAIDPKMIKGYTLDVRLVLPFHTAIQKKIQDTQTNIMQIAEYSIPQGERVIQTRAYYAQVHEMPIYFISGEPIPNEAPVYSQDPFLDGVKYSFFSVAVLELLRHIDWKPDIIQANDWHSALSVYLLPQLRQQDNLYSHIKSILIIHNLPYMGGGYDRVFPLYYFNIQSSQDNRLPDWARSLPLPLGISKADLVITVSPTYAREIMTPQFGCGLEQLLQSRSDTVIGIVNGLDPDEWDPQKDQTLPKSFSLSNMQLRQINKLSLLTQLNLDSSQDQPLFIMITRMDYQKGVDLAVQALRMISDQPWQAIILGTGDPNLENTCRQLENDFPDRVRAIIRFDSQMAHVMYGGGDSIIMPSRYEPCGLSQMIAMRYGCIPIAYATGGLIDTIHDDSELILNTGFLFYDCSPEGLANSLRRVINSYFDHLNWQKIQMRCMNQDFSWNKSALEYTQLYLKMCD